VVSLVSPGNDPLYAAYGEVTSVTLVATRQDLSRWTREHVGVPGITWSVEPGPGGTMLIVEHAYDRAAAIAAVDDAPAGRSA
jgi:hypothetical protein